MCTLNRHGFWISEKLNEKERKERIEKMIRSDQGRALLGSEAAVIAALDRLNNNVENDLIQKKNSNESVLYNCTFESIFKESHYSFTTAPLLTSSTGAVSLASSLSKSSEKEHIIFPFLFSDCSSTLSDKRYDFTFSMPKSYHFKREISMTGMPTYTFVEINIMQSLPSSQLCKREYNVQETMTNESVESDVLKENCSLDCLPTEITKLSPVFYTNPAKIILKNSVFSKAKREKTRLSNIRYSDDLEWKMMGRESSRQTRRTDNEPLVIFSKSEKPFQIDDKSKNYKECSDLLRIKQSTTRRSCVGGLSNDPDFMNYKDLYACNKGFKSSESEMRVKSKRSNGIHTFKSIDDNKRKQNSIDKKDVILKNMSVCKRDNKIKLPVQTKRVSFLDAEDERNSCDQRTDRSQIPEQLKQKCKTNVNLPRSSNSSNQIQREKEIKEVTSHIQGTSFKSKKSHKDKTDLNCTPLNSESISLLNMGTVNNKLNSTSSLDKNTTVQHKNLKLCIEESYCNNDTTDTSLHDLNVLGRLRAKKEIFTNEGKLEQLLKKKSNPEINNAGENPNINQITPESDNRLNTSESKNDPVEESKDGIIVLDNVFQKYDLSTANKQLFNICDKTNLISKQSKNEDPQMYVDQIRSQFMEDDDKLNSISTRKTEDVFERSDVYENEFTQNDVNISFISKTKEQHNNVNVVNDNKFTSSKLNRKTHKRKSGLTSDLSTRRSVSSTLSEANDLKELNTVNINELFCNSSKNIEQNQNSGNEINVATGNQFHINKNVNSKDLTKPKVTCPKQCSKYNIPDVSTAEGFRERRRLFCNFMLHKMNIPYPGDIHTNEKSSPTL